MERGSFNGHPLTWETLRKHVGKRLCLKRLHGSGWIIGYLHSDGEKKYWLENDEGIRYLIALNRQLKTAR